MKDEDEGSFDDGERLEGADAVRGVEGARRRNCEAGARAADDAVGDDLDRHGAREERARRESDGVAAVVAHGDREAGCGAGGGATNAAAALSAPSAHALKVSKRTRSSGPSPIAL